MSKNTLLMLRAGCAILVGILLMTSPEAYTLLMVQIIGGIFLVAGLVPVIGFWFPASAGSMRPVFPVVGTGSVLLGVLLLLFPSSFVRAFMYVLATLFLVGGVQQLLSQISARSMMPVRWWSVILSVVVILLGISIFANPIQSASVPFFLLGIGCVVYGASELIRGIRCISYEHKTSHKDEYVDYEEVKDDDDTMRK